MNKVMLPMSLVGSYAQPDWLIDRKKLAARFPPRVRAKELWRVAPEYLEQAQDDATLLAIRDQERAGLGIITDGEQRRESYSNRFATALEGVDIDNPGTALDRGGYRKPDPITIWISLIKFPVPAPRIPCSSEIIPFSVAQGISLQAFEFAGVPALKTSQCGRIRRNSLLISL